MKNMINRYKPFILTCLTCLAAITGAAQVIGDKYKGKFVETTVEETYDSYSAIAISATHDGNTQDANACDGNEDTRWTLANRYKDRPWWGGLVEDYDKVEEIKINIQNVQRQGVKITVYSSNTEPTVDAVDDGVLTSDLSTWNIVGTVETGGTSTNYTLSGISLTGKYVILAYELDADENTVHLNEIYFRSNVQTTTTEKVVYDYTQTKVMHKPAKWYDVFELKCNGISDEAANADSFDEKKENEPAMLNSPAKTTEDGHIKIQNTHVLVDAIYVKKGKNITLTVPDWLGSRANNRTYQRWYNYETDGTFATGAELNSTDVEVDWLTPGAGVSGGPTNGEGYRFANGYIGSPLSENPLYTMNFHYPENGADHYIVACDLSGYNDFTEKYSEESKSSVFFTEGATEAWEPTLSHRILYYIIAVEDEMPTVDVKNITFAATRIPNNTEEMVALSRDARAYTIPSNEADDEVTLKAKILDDASITDKAEISLLNADGNGAVTLTGEQRVISFKYNGIGTGANGENSDGTLSVTDGSKATIVVYNTKTATGGSDGTEVARFNLTFVEKDRLMTQSQVARLNYITKNKLLQDETEVAKLSDWEMLVDRTPQYLDDLYISATELNFDFEDDIETDVGNQSEVYPFPLLWSSSTYGFYDGSIVKNEFMSSKGNYTENHYPEWGYYGIISEYMECAGWGWNGRFQSPNDIKSQLDGISDADIKAVRNNSLKSQGSSSVYHLYADVSDRPGTIARLPFNDNLCRGTELFVTAWVKAARGGKNNNETDPKNNAGALFTIMGVKETDEDGNPLTDDAGNKIKEYTPIYSYSTGQIPTTYYNDKNVNLPGFCGYTKDAETIDGTTNAESANNEWMQAFFSFVNETNRNFDSYALQIDNNSASTDGGDIYIDDIRVYIRPVRPTVTQLTANCDYEKVRLNVNMSFDRILSRVGAQEETTATYKKSKLAFTLVEKNEFDAAIGENPTTESIAAAIEKAKVNVYPALEGAATDYMPLTFNNNFSQNGKYSVADGTRLPEADGNDFALRVMESESGERMLTVDFFADVRANHSYYMLLNTDGAEFDGAWTEMFNDYGQTCAIDTVFTVAPQNMLRINGEIVDPTLDYCSGTTYNFTAELRVPTGEIDDLTNQDVYEALDEAVDKVYYDWFFGTEAVYNEPNEPYNMSLKDALKTFRARGNYPDAEAIEDAMYDENKVSTDVLDIIKYYSAEAEGAASGQHAHPLVLHQKTLNITLLSSGLNLIVQPIQTDLDDDTDVCWNYIPLTLNVTNSAPTVKPGFNTVKYPGGEEGEDDYRNLDPCLRIGLQQIKSVSTDKAANPDGHSITIDLRAAKYSTIDAQQQGLYLMDDEGSDEPDAKIDGLYLVSTDDPAYSQFFVDGNTFDQYSLPAGKISSFEAHEYGEQGTADLPNYMTLQFDLTSEITTNILDEAGTPLKFKFEPKEGYTYNFAVHFVEHGTDNKPTTACPGHLVLPVKVVPKYVKWEGADDGSGNWNNDTNWKRVSATDLKIDAAPAGGSENLYDETVYNNAEGFVPMLFTKVIMPEGSKVQLYRAGYLSVNDGSKDEKDASWDSNKPEGLQDPTLNIQYDLMAYGNESAVTGDIVTQLYRVNLCDEIHFEPGAEMLRPEYLLYNKAWIDMEVPAGEWTLVSSPLQGVVSGDWYTKQSGVQDTEYFTDITFTADYNRLKPFVTQRTWGTGASVVENASGSSTDNNVPVSFTTTWSSLFNDTSVPYTSGNGYSVRTAGINASDQTQTFETLTFRFPKADTSYDYSSGTITRTNPGRLVTDGILKRVNEVTGDGTITDVTENEYIKIDEDVEGITLTNIAKRTDEQGTMRYAIVGNPFMANLDVSKFIEVNSNVLEPKYWIDSNVSGNAAGTATQNGDAWTWTESTDGLVGQYKAFCVQLKPNADPVVKFTPDMAELTMTADEATTTANFTITAKNDERASSAALAYDAQADNGYVSVEDAELMTDILGNGNRLAVYTVADNTAVSVNKIKDLHLIPVGLFANDDDVTTVTFTGVAALLEPTLYDAETNTETALTEGYTLTIDGESHGRYFIRTRGAGEGTTDIEETVTDDVNNVNVYSVENGKVVVASDTELLDVMIYSVGGAVLKHETVSSGRTAITLDNVDSGVVIVKVTTADCTITRKIIVR